MHFDLFVPIPHKLLPRKLQEAGEFVRDAVLREKLGTSMFDSHATIILKEIDECQPYANKKSIDKHYLGLYSKHEKNIQ